jgi:hypothetical protein
MFLFDQFDAIGESVRVIGRELGNASKDYIHKFNVKT